MWQTLAKARSDESRTDVMKNNAMQRATNAFNEKASHELSGLVENGHVEVGLEGALKERVGGAVRAFTPIVNTETVTVFSQQGVVRESSDDNQSRVIGHVGFGARWMPFVASDLLLGANLFFDQDLTRNHRRVSLGGELADADLMLSANVYQHVSGWRSSEDFASDYVEERAADGWDVRARYKVPYVEHLTLMGSYERWRGDHVAALGASDSIGKNPSAYQIGLEYRPVPALLFSASQQWDSVNEKSTRIGVAMNVPISADWAQAFKPYEERSNFNADAFRFSFVDRNYTMPLAYRSKPGHYRIVSCDASGPNEFCVRVTDGFEEPVSSAPVLIEPGSRCVSLDQPENAYSTNEHGLAYFSVLSSCKAQSSVKVSVGQSSVVLPIVITSVTWALSASPKEISENGESKFILSTGEHAVAGVPVEWDLEGAGRLTNLSGKTDSNGRAQALFRPYPNAMGEYVVKVTAKVDGERFTDVVRVKAPQTKRELTVEPEVIRSSSIAKAVVTGLQPDAEVEWTLPEHAGLRLSGSKGDANARLLLKTKADDSGTATCFIRESEENTSTSKTTLAVQIVASKETLTKVLTVVHEDGGIDGGAGGATRLRLSSTKTSMPYDALSGAQTVTLTLTGGQRGAKVSWQAENATLSASETTFEKCGGRGCTTSVVVTGVTPYAGTAIVTATSGHASTSYTIDYRNYDQGVLRPEMETSEMPYGQSFDLTVTGVMPDSEVFWYPSADSKPAASTSRADASGRASMTYGAVTNADIATQNVRAKYMRNANESKDVSIDIPMEDWTKNVTLTANQDYLVKDETLVFTLAGGREGGSVEWLVNGYGTIKDKTTKIAADGTATLKLQGSSPWSGVTVVTAVVRKTNSVSRDVQLVEYRYVYCERCFYGDEAMTPAQEVLEKATAIARAAFPATCTAPQVERTEVKCDEELVSNNDHGCVIGEKTTERVNGEYSLTQDPCSDGDVLIGQHTCGTSSYLAIQVKGFKSTRISLGYTLRNIAHRTNSSCTADYEWTKRECSGPTCTAKLGARVYYNGYMTGSMRLTLTYVNESYYLKDEWVDHCASIREKVQDSTTENAS